MITSCLYCCIYLKLLWRRADLIQKHGMPLEKKHVTLRLKIKRYPLWWWGWRGRWRRCSDRMLTWRRRRGWWTGSTGNCERGRNNVTVVLNEYFSDTTGLWECGWFYSSLTRLSTGHSRDLRRREHLIRHCVAKEGVCGTYNMATFRGM